LFVKLCEFVQPASLSAAREHLRELGPRGIALAGGTSLHFLQHKVPLVAVDITRLGLSFIHPTEDGHFAIGAATPLSDIQRYRAPRWALHEICRHISTHQIRNISTIGGNICRVFPWADLPVVLLAMNARMVVYAGKDLEVGADEFFDGQPAKRFEGGDLLKSVKVPVLGVNQGFGSVKVVRTAAAFSMVTVASVLELKDGHIKSARVAAGSAIPFPRRLPEVEAALLGREPTAAVFQEAAKKAATEVPWRGREGMSPEYSSHLAEVALVDALERATTFARERAT
jgi:CO/xanthine dehydrogenase FAD-binding subunit